METRQPTATDPPEDSAWTRPDQRAVSGVCRLFSERLGLSLRMVRAFFLLGFFFGWTLLALFGIFDHSLVEGGVADGMRGIMAVLGGALILLYPLLALFLPDRHTPRRWDFGSATGGILLLTLVGQGVGQLLGPHVDALVGTAPFAPGLSDVVLLLFFLCSGTFVFLQRRAFVAFFRAMHTGTSLVILSTVAIAIGVLVPQIDGFEDPNKRVNLERERADFEIFKREGYQNLPQRLQDGHEQYQAFRWAEGYFLYHLYHVIVPFTSDLPSGELGPSMEEGLERYGMRYGREQEKNTRKQMVAAFGGQQRIDEIGAFITRHEDALWRAFEVSTLLHLNRTYKSTWFASLLTLLGVSVFLSAYKGWRFRANRIPFAAIGAAAAVLFTLFLRASGAIRIPWAPDFLVLLVGIVGVSLVLGPGVPKSAISLQKLGFFVVHNGLLILLLGGGVSKVFTVRGILQLDLRMTEPQDTFYRFFQADKRSQMPFGVLLQDFSRRDWLTLQVDFPQEGFRARSPRHTLWEGKTLELDYVETEEGKLEPNLVIDVVELYDQAELGLVKVKESAAPSDTPMPIAEVRVEGGQGDGRALLLPLRRPSATFETEVLRDPDNAWRLAAAYGPNPTKRFPANDDRLGMLEWTVTGEGDGQPEVVDVELGQTLTIDGGYQIRVVQATSDFRMDVDTQDGSTHPRPLAEQPMNFVALWVDIIPPGEGGEVERRLLFEALNDVDIGRQESFFHSGVFLRYFQDRWSSPGPPRHLLAWEPGQEPALITEDGQRLPIELGAPLPLPGAREVTPLQLLQNADFENNLSFLASELDENGWDKDFYSRMPRGGVFDVTMDAATDQPRTERIELATTEEMNSSIWFSPNQEVVLQFQENSEMLPFEWRSVLKIFERDNAGQWFEARLGPEPSREIRVNDYLYYRGYRLFQTNADAQVPTYSGIGVVYDPGIPLVLLGMYTVIAGGAIAFLLRPMVRGWGQVPKEKTA